ncbi:MAG: YezD family protein [Vicinamibacteria bacterium]
MSSNRVGIQDNADTPGGSWERQVIEAVRGIRYGSVEVVIHDGRIVHIERREKVRLEEASRRRPDDRGERSSL